MMRSVLHGALLLATLFLDHALLEGESPAPITSPAICFDDLPEAPRPRQQDFLPPREIAALNSGGQAVMVGKGGSAKRPPAPATPPAMLGIPGNHAVCVPDESSVADSRMSCNPDVNPYARFLNTSAPYPLTPRQKFLLAWRDISDPFNLLTIGGEAAIAIGSNAESHYGPGIPGFAKYAGVSLTQDMTGEFFSTFLIPSLAGQDPRYHRMPNLPIRRRILHVIDEEVIAQSDNGLPMFNYATVFGTIGNSALGNLYVPGRKTNWGASVARISVALATDPIGNAITEFLPDVARRVNINVVLVQRVINRVAIEEGGAPAQ